MNFSGKNVLITGGSRGIGKAASIAFAKAGANIGINFKSDINSAKETLALLEGENHTLFQSDISNENKCEKLVNDFIDRYGKIDILVNNAATFDIHPVDKVDFETWKQSWKKIIDTNLIAVSNICYCAAQNMMKNKSGRIVNVSSRGAFRGEPLQPAYGASKAGLNSLSQSLAKVLGKYNIFVGVVAPGFTDTEMGNDVQAAEDKNRFIEETPLKRLAKPEEVAHTIVFLASRGAEFTTGTIIDVNGASYLRT